jgi:hypothetical protein
METEVIQRFYLIGFELRVQAVVTQQRVLALYNPQGWALRSHTKILSSHIGFELRVHAEVTKQRVLTL